MSGPVPDFKASFGCRRVVVGAEQRRVEHHIRVFAVFDQRGKNLVPNRGLGTSGQALLRGLSLAIALRQVAAVLAGAQHPTASVDQQPGVSACASGRLP